jgi:hypothetical protein
MKFDASKVNAPHPQPGQYGSKGSSGQVKAFENVINYDSNGDSHTAYPGLPTSVATTDQLQRSPSAVPTNNSNPLHHKQQVSCTMCGQVIDGAHAC